MILREHELEDLLCEKLGAETFALLQEWLQLKLDDLDNKIDQRGIHSPHW